MLIVRPSARLGAAQAPITTSASSQQSAAFGAQTYQIRVCVIANPCWIKIGDNPTATANDTLLPVNSIEYFTVTPGQKLAVLQQTGAGTLSITEIV